MEIRQFRLVVRARDFERTCRFYGEVLSFPRLQIWDREDGRGALYQAGAGVIEVLGRPPQGFSGRDEGFDYEGPEQKLSIAIVVSSAQRVYEEVVFRDRNVPGGLQKLPDGSVVFVTHDPDGVRLAFREPEA